MTILLCDTLDDAFVAYVTKFAKSIDYKIGRTLLQKICYFLKAKGIPFKYEFEMHHFGPFSHELFFRVDDLLADNIIEDIYDSPNKSQYQPDDEADVLLDMYKEELGLYGTEIEKVIILFNKLTPPQMELLSTIHYVHQSKLRFNGIIPTKQQVVEGVIGYKRDKFAKTYIESAYDVMKEHDLLNWIN